MPNTINETDIRAIMGGNLKRLRTAKNCSQKGLAIKTGLAHNFVNDIENGRKWLSPKTLAALAVALDAEPYEFFAPEGIGQEPPAVTGRLEAIAEDFRQTIADFKNRHRLR